MAQEVKPVEQVKTVEEYHEQAPRRWPSLLLYLFIALVVAAILVFGARSVYRHNHKLVKKDSAASTTGESGTASGSSDNGSISVNSGSGSGSSSGSNSSSNSNSSSGSSSSNGSSNSNLPNSGPGQVAGLFIGATIAGAGAHYVISSRRQKSTN